MSSDTECKGSLEDLIQAYTQFFMSKVKKADKNGSSELTFPLDAECHFRFPPLRKLGVQCCCYLTNTTHSQPMYVMRKIRLELAFHGIASRMITFKEDETDCKSVMRYSLEMQWRKLYDGTLHRPKLQDCAYFYFTGSIPTYLDEVCSLWESRQRTFLELLTETFVC